MNRFIKNLTSAIFKSLPITCTLFVLSCANDPNKPVEVSHQYGTGEISRKYYTVNGKKEGTMTEYFVDGKVKAEREFKQDVQTGRALVYSPNGKIQETAYYEQGQKHGGDTIWHENGRPQTAVQFNMGKKDGLVQTWDQDGKLIFEAKYELDSLVEVKGEKIAAPPTPAKAEVAKPALTPTAAAINDGPTGYISRKESILQNAPKADAPKTGSFKIYEEVIILETKMTDESGQENDLPQWYKVRTKGNKVGWISAKHVTVN